MSEDTSSQFIEDQCFKSIVRTINNGFGMKTNG